ncbi:hypothetical protein QQF64_025844 [Cirrhinus molitorella]|uniref:DDE-1 domain-containing protein n=1 Tax=Cirrhinus molitorella TaxID=172907 RepID=A0ABR3NRC9_9TELE
MAKQRRVSDEALELIFSNESFGDELTDASGSDADTWCSEEEYSRGIDPFEDNAYCSISTRMTQISAQNLQNGQNKNWKKDPQFTQKILFSDEANFYVNGEVNRQNHRYWSDTNPHWIDPSKTVGTKKVMVRAFLDEQFPEKWIGHRGPVEWPPRSPDLTPLDFYLWGHLKAIVYGVKIRDVQHLKLRILEACASISPAVLLSVCEEWEKRVALTINTMGSTLNTFYKCQQDESGDALPTAPSMLPEAEEGVQEDPEFQQRRQWATPYSPSTSTPKTRRSRGRSRGKRSESGAEKLQGDVLPLEYRALWVQHTHLHKFSGSFLVMPLSKLSVVIPT